MDFQSKQFNGMNHKKAILCAFPTSPLLCVQNKIGKEGYCLPLFIQ